MKYIAWVFLLLSSPLFGQNADSILKEIRIYDGYVGLSWRLSNGTNYQESNVLVIDNDSLFDAFMWHEETPISRPDFNEKVLIVQSVGGDCFMRVYPEVEIDSSANQIQITVYNLWGGCRAGGSKTLIAEVPIPDNGMQFYFEEIQLEREEELEQYGVLPGGSTNE